MVWDRATPWRQGHVLPTEAIHVLGLFHQVSPDDTVVVVISHDCDLANDDLKIEPDVELIIARRIDAVRGDCTNAKVPRRLHLAFTTPDGMVAVELIATDKRTLPKTALGEFVPLPWELNESDFSVLQRWLGARYRRAAFPDAFETILKEAKLHEKIAKILAPLGNTISAIFFDVQELDKLYSLGITLLYDTGVNPGAAEEVAKQAALSIEQAFTRKLFKEGRGWQGIELAYCDPMSDEAMTYRQSTMLKQWRLEFLSLRAEPQQSMTAE